MATLRDVAKLAGTSIAAVSAVLNGSGRQSIRVGEATRARILEAARTLDYQVNSVARSLVTGKSRVLGLVMPYAGGFAGWDPFTARCMSGLVAAAIQNKYNLMLYTAIGEKWNSPGGPNVSDGLTDGLVLVIPLPESTAVAQCLQHSLPCVAIIAEPRHPEICTINADDFAAGRLAAEHLVSLGHRRIAHLHGPVVVWSAGERQRGFRAGLEAAGRTLPPRFLIPSGYVEREGFASMQQLLAMSPGRRPTAVFAGNDLCAIGAMRAIRESGLRIPEDIAIIGCDDSPIAMSIQPNLTSIRLPVEEMGGEAIRTLIQLVEGTPVPERNQVIPVQLIVRESTVKAV